MSKIYMENNCNFVYEMKLFCLFAVFLGCSRASDCNYWRRRSTIEDPHPKGPTLFFATTSPMFKCSMMCSEYKNCVMFSYDQQTENCTGYQSFRFNSSHVHTTPGHCFYKVVQIIVAIKTDTDTWADTNSKVFLKIYGSFGSTNEIELEDNTSGYWKFERGNTDVFNMTSLDVGAIQRIKIGHDGSDDLGWKVETITISVNGHPGITFEINGWLEDSTQYMTIDAP